MPRKNLTISLDSKDWALVRDSAASLGSTYSGLFHRLIQEGLATDESDPSVTSKYRALFQGSSDFFKGRAAVWAKAARAGKGKP